MLSRMKFEFDPLIEEILNGIPISVWNSKDKTFCDPAIGGGQIVKAIEERLRKHGHSEKNIKARVFGFEESELHIRYAVNKHKLIGQYTKKEYDDYFESDDSMKFDVVIGNPPYQDPSGQNTLYPKFYVKAINSVKPDGYVAMITPPAIIPGLWGVKDPDGIKMPAPINIEKVVIGQRLKNFFPGVSSEFCYFILENTTPDNTSVEVETDAGVITASGPLFPKSVDPKGVVIAQHIINKCFKFGCDPYSATSGDHGRSAHFDPKGKDLAVESISTDGTVRTRPITWTKAHAHYNSPKVIMPLYGKVAHIDRTHKLVSASQEKTSTGRLTGHNVCTILTKSDNESESLVSLLESRLQRFFTVVTSETRAPYINFVKNFVGVPLNQIWTDDLLEKHLKLTKEEREWLNEHF